MNPNIIGFSSLVLFFALWFGMFWVISPFDRRKMIKIVNFFTSFSLFEQTVDCNHMDLSPFSYRNTGLARDFDELQRLWPEVVYLSTEKQAELAEAPTKRYAQCASFSERKGSLLDDDYIVWDVIDINTSSVGNFAYLSLHAPVEYRSKYERVLKQMIRHFMLKREADNKRVWQTSGGGYESAYDMDERVMHYRFPADYFEKVQKHLQKWTQTVDQSDKQEINVVGPNIADFLMRP